MSKAVRSGTRTGIRRVAVGCVAVVAALALTAAPSMATTVALTTAALPTLNGVTLNGQTQTTTTTWTMTNALKMTSSGTNNGWKLTVGATDRGHAQRGAQAVLPSRHLRHRYGAGICRRRVHASSRLADMEHDRRELDVGGPAARLSVQRHSVLQDRQRDCHQGGLRGDDRCARHLDVVGHLHALACDTCEPAQAADGRGLPRRRRVDALKRPVNL